MAATTTNPAMANDIAGSAQRAFHKRMARPARNAPVSPAASLSACSAAARTFMLYPGARRNNNVLRRLTHRRLRQWWRRPHH